MAQLLQMNPDGSAQVLDDSGQTITVSAADLPAVLSGGQAGTPSYQFGGVMGNLANAAMGRDPAQDARDAAAAEDPDAGLADTIATEASEADPRSMSMPSGRDMRQLGFDNPAAAVAAWSQDPVAFEREMQEEAIRSASIRSQPLTGVDQRQVTTGNVAQTDRDGEIDALLAQIQDPVLQARFAREMGRPLIPDLPAAGLGDEQIAQLADQPSIEGGVIMRTGTPGGSYEMIRDPLARMDERYETQQAMDLASLDQPIQGGGGYVPTDADLLGIDQGELAFDPGAQEEYSKGALNYALRGDEAPAPEPAPRRVRAPREVELPMSSALDAVPAGPTQSVPQEDMGPPAPDSLAIDSFHMVEQDPYIPPTSLSNALGAQFADTPRRDRTVSEDASLLQSISREDR